MRLSAPYAVAVPGIYTLNRFKQRWEMRIMTAADTG